MSAGTAYSKRYGAGFVDLPTKTTAIDQLFLNAVETALLQLIGAAPTADGQVAQWDNVNTRYGPALLLNKNIDPAAAIVKSKLDLTGANGIVDADVAGAAAIARSKLNFGSGLVNADIAAAAAIAASKVVGVIDGWVPMTQTLTYSSTDGHTFVVTTGGVDLTGVIPVGARLRVTNQAATQYFIVTAISATTITLYGGTNYSLTNTAISAPSYSLVKAPIGFPMRKDLWTEFFAPAAQNQASPTAGTFYNLGAQLWDIPVGDWNVTCEFTLQATWGVAGLCGVLGGIGTVSNGVPDQFLYGAFGLNSAVTGAGSAQHFPIYRSLESLVLAATTRYYLIAGADTTTLSNIGIGSGSYSEYSKFQAVCNYL
jgi:hypothetical protein